MGGFDSLLAPPTSSSGISVESASTSSSGHSHGVDIHYHHPRGVQPDLHKSKLPSNSIQDSSNSDGGSANQSKLSSSLAALKAVRGSAGVDTLTSPVLLTLPTPISIAAARPMNNLRNSSKNIDF